MKLKAAQNIQPGGTLFLFIFLLFGVVIAGATFARADPSSAVHKRCAFDIGSGETKLTAAEVRLAGSSPTIRKLLTNKVLLPFARSLKDGNIPDGLIKEAISKLNDLRSQCEALGVREYSGVATSGFRMAQNAQAALAQIFEQTQISLRVISGEQEAVLGFLAAASALKSSGAKLVVWDIGGGSLQFSMRADSAGAERRKYVISSGHRGAELFRKEIAKRFRRGRQPVNPLTQDEMREAIALAKEWSRGVNARIVEQLRRDDSRVVGLGSTHTESLVAQAGLQSDPPYKLYTLDRVRAAARRAVNLTDEDFRKAYPANNYPANQATNVALVLGYMEGLQIKEVIPLEVTLADGLLVDETYWPGQKPR